MFNTYKTYPLPYYMNSQAYNPYFFTQFPMENILFIDETEPTSKRDLLQSSKENAPSQSNKVFTLNELAQYDGTKGNPAYVAVNGIVYDVSGISDWSGGTHYGLTAGKDLTTQFETCHGVTSILSNLPTVGILRK